MTLFRGGIFPRLIAVFPLLFPLYLLKGEPFGIPVTLTEVVLLFAVIYFVIREEIWKDSWFAIHKRDILIWPVILFILAGIFGVIVAPDVTYFLDGTEFPAKFKALGILKGWILAPIAYFYMARYYFRDKPSLIGLSLRSLLLTGIALSLFAYYQVWTGDFTTMDMRASGPFESANYLALYLGPLVVYSFLALLKTKDNSDRFFLGAGLIICGLALFFTQSFAAWIAVLVTLFIGFGFYMQKQSMQARVMVFILILAAGVTLFMTQLGTEKFAQFLEFSERSSSSVRLQVYDISWDLIKQNPIFGIGFGQFEQFYQVNAVEILGHEPFEWNMLHPHNIFFAFWLNAGLLGLVAFVWLLKESFAWFLEEDAKERRIVAFMVLALVIHGLFDTPIFKNDLAFEFWMLMAILI